MDILDQNKNTVPKVWHLDRLHKEIYYSGYMKYESVMS